MGRCLKQRTTGTQEIRWADEPETAPAVAWIHLEVEGPVERILTLWADEAHSTPYARVEALCPTPGQPITYRVRAPDGDVLGTITRDPALRGRRLRTRWNVRPEGLPAAVGRQGPLWLWTLWWVILPFQSVVVLLGLIGGAFSGAVPPPQRITWRAQGTTVLTYTDRNAGCHVELHDPAHDPRLVAGLLAVRTYHRSPEAYRARARSLETRDASETP
ncbi:hypothetical protein ACFYWS_15495 [Streptomyces sp. NPDC002795]|uniref:hypothetical protein n=1 Tax=Streptomyces sp. NPDC002795 TaxID=3364665 RepID=UPI0036870127